MHKKYARDGVACVSVSVDQVEDKERALKFLKAKGATFANYLLDEDNPSVWQEYWDTNGPPAVFVYDPAGKLARAFRNGPEEHYTYDDVETFVRKLLSAQGRGGR